MRARLLLVGLVLAAAAGCAAEGGTKAGGDGHRAAAGLVGQGLVSEGLVSEGSALEKRAADFDVLLPWGEGEGAVGWRAPAADFAGDGPSGIGVAPDGRVLVVDRLQQRLVAVDGAGPETVGAAAQDVEMLAVRGDGALALFSPLRSRASLRDADGRELGEVAVPRMGTPVVRVTLDPASRVVVETAFQERLWAGSPAAPVADAAFLRSKREGALALVDGRSVVARREGSGAVIEVLSAPEKGRAQVTLQVEVAPKAAAVRLLGGAGDRVAVLVEEVDQPSDALEVHRWVAIVDLTTRAVVEQVDVPRRGTWMPREAIALGGSPPALAWMTPEPAGLRVVRTTVASLAKGGVQ